MPQAGAYLMENANSLGEIYADLEPKNSIRGRKVHRLCQAVDFLDRNKPSPCELSKLFDRFQKRRDTAKKAPSYAEYQLLCAHLSWLGSAQKMEELDREHQLFRSINSKDGLLSREEENLKDENNVSFLLHSHERQASANLSRSGGFRRDVFDSASKEDFFSRIVKVLEMCWPDKLLGISHRTLDTHLLLRNSFLEFMHKQLLQNVLCHAFADSTFNAKYNKFYRNQFATEGDEFMFGVLAFLDVQLLDPEVMDEIKFASELQSVHPRLAKDEDRMHAKLKAQKKRVLVFSYCDSGPGIERHITQFSPRRNELPKKFDVKFIVDNRIAGRDDVGSGMGLNDVRQLAREVSAKFIIETPRTIYLDDYSNNLELSLANRRLSRGTSATILLEV